MSLASLTWMLMTYLGDVLSFSKMLNVSSFLMFSVQMRHGTFTYFD